MKIINREGNIVVFKMPDGVAIVDITELVMGSDTTIIGTFFHEDYPTIPHKIIRLSTQTQQILGYLITGEIV